MKIPKKLKVGGHTYSIIRHWTTLQSPHPYGRSLHDSKEIRLAKAVEPNRNIAETEYEESFLHEILHCVDYEYNGKAGLRESDIRQLSRGLYQVLTDNKLLR